MILVTGGAGFIGSHLAEELLRIGHKVLVVDNLSTGKLENLPESPNLKFIKGDLSDLTTVKEIFSSFNISKVFHLAAVASVQKSVDEPIETHKTNCDATIYLLEESKKRKVEKFIFASSAAVYGSLPQLPKKEDMAVEPLTPYGVDKYASERYTVNACKLYGLKSVALRFFNVYGEKQDPSSPYSGVISIFIDRAVRFLKGEKTKIVIYGDGKQTRDFVYVKDVVQALILVSEKEEASGKVFNVGTGKETNLLKILSTIEEITGTLPPVKFAPPRKGDIKRSVADIGEIEKLGYKPNYSLKEGLKRLLDWELQNQRL